MDPVHISLLGGFSVQVAGKPIGPGWRLNKAKTLVGDAMAAAQVTFTELGELRGLAAVQRMCEEGFLTQRT